MSAFTSLANPGNRGSLIRSKDLPYHLDSNAVTPSPPDFVLIGKYESSAIAEAAAHQRAETKIIAFTGFAYPDIAPELFPKLRVPTGIYHNSVQVPGKSFIRPLPIFCPTPRQFFCRMR